VKVRLPKSQSAKNRSTTSQSVMSQSMKSQFAKSQSVILLVRHHLRRTTRSNVRTHRCLHPLSWAAPPPRASRNSKQNLRFVHFLNSLLSLGLPIPAVAPWFIDDEIQVLTRTKGLLEYYDLHYRQSLSWKLRIFFFFFLIEL
jgi:hypothetical protein